MRAARWLLGVAAVLALGGCATTDKNGDLFGEGSWAFDARAEPEAERLVAVPGTAAAAVELPEQEGGYPDVAEETYASDRVLRPRGLDGVALPEPSAGAGPGIGYSVIVAPGTPLFGGANSPFIEPLGILPPAPVAPPAVEQRAGSSLMHQPGEVQPAPPRAASPGSPGDSGGGTGAGLPPPGTGP